MYHLFKTIRLGGETMSKAMISVKNLSHSYENDGKMAVKNISFEIRPGETFGFLGPSGAGKSKTQGILTGLLKQQDAF